MARIRKFSAYRKIERPYTRISKYRKKNYIRANPPIQIARFIMGNAKGNYKYTIKLVSKEDLQIRSNAIESARLTTNKMMEEELGKQGYMIRINKYPHHILRENPLASGAGADRMSTGMKMSFGNPIGHAAQIKTGDTIFTIKTNKRHVDLATKALNRARTKLPKGCYVQVSENKA
jgi:large subunit ribosomal protein L10e